MRIDPELYALRSNSAPQRKAQQMLEGAKDDWRSTPQNRAIFDDLARFGAGAALHECDRLERLFTQAKTARVFTEKLIAALLPEMASHPLGQIPFRHQNSGAVSVLQIAASGQATMSLVMYERTGGSCDQQTVCFTDCQRHEAVLAGHAAIEIVRRDNSGENTANLHQESLALAQGDTLALSGRTETKIIKQVADRLLVLRLSRSPVSPMASLEFRLSDGVLVHRASGERRDSRHELMLALLGRMGRIDAAPIMAEMTQTGADHLRWEALRECLALDTVEGFSALNAMAKDQGDTLCVHAQTLRAQLIETHPELAAIESMLCPA